MSRDVRAYPLSWPIGRGRIQSFDRVRSSFGRMVETKSKHSTNTWKSKKAWTFAQTRSDLYDELDRLGAIDVVISTDLPLRQDGEAHANRRADDPAVAVYFRRADDHGDLVAYAMGADRYDRLPDNMRALVAVIEAMRKIERHGSPQLMEQAFSAFTALPPSGSTAKPWHEVLGIEVRWRGIAASLVRNHVKSRYRELMRANARAFTTAGTAEDSERAREINEARDAAFAELDALGEHPW